jgi:hypothetical protein
MNFEQWQQLSALASKEPCEVDGSREETERRSQSGHRCGIETGVVQIVEHSWFAHRTPSPTKVSTHSEHSWRNIS